MARTKFKQVQINNPYKFRVKRTSAQNTTGGSFSRVNFNSEDFDTNNNFDSTTNYRYTAPVSGFYQLNAKVNASSPNAQIVIALYKNGSLYARGGHSLATGAVNGISYADIVQLAANDYVEIFCYTDTTAALEVSSGAEPFFSGYLVSTD